MFAAGRIRTMNIVARVVALLVAASVASRCVIVGGKLRPAWKPTWSAVTCTEARLAELQDLHVRAMYEGEHALPGVAVTAEPVRPASLAPWQYTRQEYTNERGEAVLRLPPGSWKIRIEHGGFRSVERIVLISREHQCRLTAYTTMSSFVTVQ